MHRSRHLSGKRGCGPILYASADASIRFEASAVRLDAVTYHRPAADEYWIYYTGSNFNTKSDAIGLATCPAGRWLVAVR
jgi:hypothetical protein